MGEDRQLLLFGTHVKELRQHSRISQEQLALLSGLDRTYISGIERGKRNVSLLNILKLAASLKVPPAQLLAFDMEQHT